MSSTGRRNSHGARGLSRSSGFGESGECSGFPFFFVHYSENEHACRWRLDRFIEAYAGSKEGLGKEGDFGTMTHAALEFARGTFAACSKEHNWYEHFQLLTPIFHNAVTG
jgi:hypothetical protein